LVAVVVVSPIMWPLAIYMVTNHVAAGHLYGTPLITIIDIVVVCSSL